VPGPRDWQDRYYDGEADDIFAAFADEGTPEDSLYPLDADDDAWYDGLIPTVTVVDEETWAWLQSMLAEEPRIITGLYRLVNPEEGDGSELE